MQLKQLEVLSQIARLKSFSRAAEALYLSQPTVSAHLGALEHELGAQLVIRSTKELRLTAAGALMAHYADEILSLCHRAEQEVHTLCSDVSGVLAIAASTVPSQYLLPQVLPALRRQYPQVFFQIRQGDSGQVTRWVAEGAAEVGVVGAGVRRTGLTCVPLLSERLAIVTPNTPEYRALNGVMTPDVLRRSPFLVREPGSGTRKRAEEFLRSIGLDPKELNLAAQLESTGSVLQAVKSGLGISILSGLAAAEPADEGRVLAFDYDSPLLERQFYLLYPRHRPLSPAAAMLLEGLPRFFRRIGEPPPSP